MNITQLANNLRSYLAKDYTTGALKMLIILWAIGIIAVALWTDNRWILAGMLAWEVLP